MLSNDRFEDLSSFLKDCVQKLKDKYPRLSNAQISKKLSIPNSTFDRISKCEVKAPSLNYALKIVREICGEENLHNFIERYYPKMLGDLASVYPGNRDVPFVDADAEIFFEDPLTYELMLLATSNCALTKERTLEEFGKRGLAALSTLVEKGVLKEENGTFQIKGTVNATQGTVHKLLQNLINSNYDLGSFGSHKNWLSLQYESVNLEKAAPLLREIYIKANREVREVLNDPSMNGKDVVWAGLVFDSMTKQFNSLEDDKKVIQ